MYINMYTHVYTHIYVYMYVYVYVFIYIYILATSGGQVRGTMNFFVQNQSCFILPLLPRGSRYLVIQELGPKNHDNHSL